MSLKKSLLFIIPSLEGGGAERSLVTLLNLLDYEKYDVDLMLFRREGFFLGLVPECVNILDGGADYRHYDGSLASGFLYFIRKGKPGLAASRLRYAAAIRKVKSPGESRLVWNLLSENLPRLEKEYDAAIGYLEGNSTYYCVDKTKAKKKIGYIHSDYSKLNPDIVIDTAYFEKLDRLVAVSGECARNLVKIHPAAAAKTTVIENIVSKAEIEKLAGSEPLFDAQYRGLNLLTVGRLSPEKGIDLAVEACRNLLDMSMDLRWHIVGDGPLRNELEGLVKNTGIERNFLFLGRQTNPYKYMAQCDIYVQPSRYEGKSIAVDEAKVLAKPIVCTEFSTVHGQIEDGVTGLIAGMDAASLADKIKLLAENSLLRQKLTANLREQSVGNEGEIEKFYALLNEQ